MQLGMVLFDANKSRLQAKKELEDVGEAQHSILHAFYLETVHLAKRTWN